MPQMSGKTLSEQLVEEFCHRHHINWRPIKVAQTPGNRRPDYAIRIGGGWCILEVKELAPTVEDKARLEELRNGNIKGEWVTPGKRLRGPIRSSEGQLRKFAARNLPTVICLLDTTVSFLDADIHIRAAMYGDETLHFAVLPTTGTGQFLGSAPRKNAMLRRDERTTVSAVPNQEERSDGEHRRREHGGMAHYRAVDFLLRKQSFSTESLMGWMAPALRHLCATVWSPDGAAPFRQKTGAILENSHLNNSSKAARRHPLNRGCEKTRVMVGSWRMKAHNWHHPGNLGLPIVPTVPFPRRRYEKVSFFLC